VYRDSAVVLREGDETGLDLRIEAGLIDVGQLVRLGSGTPFEPASQSVQTTEAVSAYGRFCREGLAFGPRRSLDVVTFQKARRLPAGKVCAEVRHESSPLVKGGAGNVSEWMCLY
jgi:hypothetical protein